MRWENLTVESGGNPPENPALFGADAVATRTFDTPEFRGITFHEIRARSIVNRVPGASRMPFEWTVNPYRGCTHGCHYCFARRYHSHLELGAGDQFASVIFVKTNFVEVLRRELDKPAWKKESIGFGTATDLLCGPPGDGADQVGPCTGEQDHRRDRLFRLDEDEFLRGPARRLDRDQLGVVGQGWLNQPGKQHQ